MIGKKIEFFSQNVSKTFTFNYDYYLLDEWMNRFLAIHKTITKNLESLKAIWNNKNSFLFDNDDDDGYQWMFFPIEEKL